MTLHNSNFRSEGEGGEEGSSPARSDSSSTGSSASSAGAFSNGAPETDEPEPSGFSPELKAASKGPQIRLAPRISENPSLHLYALGRFCSSQRCEFQLEQLTLRSTEALVQIDGLLENDTPSRRLLLGSCLGGYNELLRGLASSLEAEGMISPAENGAGGRMSIMMRSVLHTGVYIQAIEWALDPGRARESLGEEFDEDIDLVSKQLASNLETAARLIEDLLLLNGVPRSAIDSLRGDSERRKRA